MSVSEELNVELMYFTVASSDFANHVKTTQAAGEDFYDFVSFNAVQLMPTLATAELYVNLKNTQNINVEAPWWNQNYNAAAGFFGSQYTLVGDLNLATYDLLGVVYFNQNMAEAYGLENPYEMVLNGEWTVERMQEMIQGIYEDLNGDGAKGTDDRFGLVGAKNGNVALFLRSCGLSLLEYSESQNTMQVSASEQAMMLMEQLTELWYRSSDAYLGAGSAAVYKMLGSDEALFAIDTLNREQGKLKQSYVEGAGISILPMPKMDEEQVDYITSTELSYNVIAVFNDTQAVGVTLV